MEFIKSHLANQVLNRVNAVNFSRPGLLHRVTRLTRWKTPTRGAERGSFYRRRRVSRWARVQAASPHRARRKISLELTLVGSRNNFWALLTRAGSVVWTLSAGSLPGFGGSKRGRLGAAGQVAVLAGAQLRRSQAAPRVPRLGPSRIRPYSGTWARRPRRWNRRGRLSRRGRVFSPVGLNLVGWTRDKRWRYAWEELKITGRTRIQVRPRRGHNGLRGKKIRRT